jgi:hypothetical protein
LWTKSEALSIKERRRESGFQGAMLFRLFLLKHGVQNNCHVDCMVKQQFKKGGENQNEILVFSVIGRA